MHLDLSEDEATPLTRELTQLINRDKYPFSERVRTLGAILGRLRSEPVPAAKPSPPPRHYEPPLRGRWRRRGEILVGPTREAHHLAHLGPRARRNGDEAAVWSDQREARPSAAKHGLS